MQSLEANEEFIAQGYLGTSLVHYILDSITYIEEDEVFSLEPEIRAICSLKTRIIRDSNSFSILKKIFRGEKQKVNKHAEKSGRE